ASGNNDTVSVAVSGNTDEYTDLPLSSSGRNFGNFTITVAFTVSQAAGSAGPGPEFGVAFWDGSADKGVDCSLFHNGTNPSDRHLGMYEATSTSQTADRSKSFAWQTGVQYTLTAARQNTTFT